MALASKFVIARRISCGSPIVGKRFRAEGLHLDSFDLGHGREFGYDPFDQLVAEDSLSNGRGFARFVSGDQQQRFDDPPLIVVRSSAVRRIVR